MENGIPMESIDRMPLAKYVRCVRAAHKNRKANEARRAKTEEDGKKPVVNLKRGTIDQIW